VGSMVCICRRFE